MKFCVILLVLFFALQTHASPIDDFKLRLIDIGHKVLKRTDFVLTQMQISRKPKEDQFLLQVKASEMEVLLKHLQVAREVSQVNRAMGLLFQAECELANRVDEYLANNKSKLRIVNL